MSVELEWCGTLSGMLVPGHLQLHYVHWAPDAERPPGLPAIALPAAADVRYHVGWPKQQDEPRLLHVDAPDDDGHTVSHELVLIDADRGRALLVDRREHEDVYENGGERFYVRLSWLDLMTGARTAFPRLVAAWMHEYWRFHMRPGGGVLAVGRSNARLFSPAGEVTDWHRYTGFGVAAVGRRAIALYDGHALERWSLDGLLRRSQLAELRLGDRVYGPDKAWKLNMGAFFQRLALDRSDRLWALGPYSMLVFDPADALIRYLSPAAFTEPDDWPDWHGLDALGRTWFADQDTFSCFRLLDLAAP